jgi:ribose 5-phosphate isomerase B
LIKERDEILMTAIFLASDHAGCQLKADIADFLTQAGHQVTDLGADGSASVDYPDFGYKLASSLKGDKAARGIAICGSGIGISIAANRFSWIRAALVHDVTNARLCREHNDANVLALGERVTGAIQAIDCVQAFLNTPFAGGRHQRRIDKLSNPKLES